MSSTSKTNGRPLGNTTGVPGAKVTSSRPTSTVPPPSVVHITTYSSPAVACPVAFASKCVVRRDIAPSPTMRNRYAKERSVFAPLKCAPS